MFLDSFPKVLWINLDRSEKRRKYMEELLNDHKIEHTRIPAIDGMNDISKYCVPSIFISTYANACTSSHMKALQYFVDNVEDDRVIIFEDDVSFEFLPYISSNWSEFEKILPDDYNVVQLAVIAEHPITTDLTQYLGYSSAAAYLIRKKAASKILRNYVLDGKVNLRWTLYPVSEHAVYRLPHVYSIPIFTYLNEDSTIHNDHLDLHKKSKNQQYQAWLRAGNKAIRYRHVPKSKKWIIIAITLIIIIFIVIRLIHVRR